MTAVSIDGVVIAPESATISVLDRGLLYGDGLFEVLRTWDGHAIDLDAHLDRMTASAELLQLRLPSRATITDAVLRTVSADGGGDRRIRILVTRGPGPLGARLADLGPGRLVVIVEPLPPAPPGISLAVVDLPVLRHAGHKTLAYLDHVLARELAAAAGADEAIRLDPDGHVVECATSNVFAITGATVATPPVDTGALPGVTRARVLACCTELGIATQVRRLTLRELHAADEIFVTSALRGVIAVTRLDGEARRAGMLTERIAQAYLAAIRSQLLLL